MQDTLYLSSNVSEWERYNESLSDGGPIYAETNMEHFIVEPWNALSSLLILAPAIYFAIRLRGQYKHYGFIMSMTPLLFLGGLGSTLFHAFRSSEYLLALDVLPTAILTLSVGVYFWLKVFDKWWYVFFVFIPAFFLRYLANAYFSSHTAINIGYAITGVTFFMPVLILLYRSGFKKGYTIIISIVLFILALYFREIDAHENHVFDIGTHFLWHILTGIGAYFLGEYLVFLRDAELKKRKLSLKKKVKTEYASSKFHDL